MRLKRMLNLASFFYVQRIRGFPSPSEPWLDAKSLAWLEDRLSSAELYLEFGSGGSTKLAAEMGVDTISVECDRFFARSVRKSLPKPHKTKIIDVDIGLTGPWGVPLPGTPNPQRLIRWRRYIEAPFAILGSFPSVILVDGRFRRACALRCAVAAQEAQAHSELLFDDYFMEGRECYRQLEDQLGKPTRIGDAAHFTLSPRSNVTGKDIDAAMQDYR